MDIRRVVRYGETMRFASLSSLSWFPRAWDEMPVPMPSWGVCEVVTDVFLEQLEKRVRTQRERCSGYSPEMLARLELAEKLLRELKDESSIEGGVESPPRGPESELPEELEGEDGTEE